MSGLLFYLHLPGNLNIFQQRNSHQNTVFHKIYLSKIYHIDQVQYIKSTKYNVIVTHLKLWVAVVKHNFTI